MNGQTIITPKLDEATLALVLYYVSKLNGVLGKTHLQKLLFLTDLISVKELKEKITSIEYQKNFYGPFSPQLAHYTNALVEKEFIEIKTFPFVSDASKSYTRFYIKKPIPIKNKLIELLGSEKMIIIDEVVNSFGNMSLQNILDIVYSLQIVKGTEDGKPLDMAKELGDVRDPDEADSEWSL